MIKYRILNYALLGFLQNKDNKFFNRLHILYSALQKKGAARSLIRKRRFIGARTPAPTPASYGPHDGVFRSIADKGDGSSIDMFKGFDVDGTSQKKRARAFATYSIKVPLRP